MLSEINAALISGHYRIVAAENHMMDAAMFDCRNMVYADHDT